MKTRFVCIGGLLVLGLWLAPQPAGAAPRYWVGNGGAWSDTNHWATSSGGAGSNSVPGASDDVYFDANSAGSATVDVSFAGTVLSLTLSNGYTGTNTQVRNLTVVNDCLIGGGAWQFTNGANASLTVNGNMTVSNATVYCQYTSLGGNGTGRTFTVGGVLTLASNGVFNANGLGFPAGQGPGKPSGDSRNSAGYGGQGGLSGSLATPNSGSGGTTYGSITAPGELGSGANAGGGGGGITLTVQGAATINGTITANGVYAQGCGSGGAVLLQAQSLSGAGTIAANGANATYSDWSGSGGGRIAVVLSQGTDFDKVAMQAYGGQSGMNGAAGTIYLQKGTDASGQGELVVDNRNTATRVTTTTLQCGTRAATNCFARMTLRNSGIFSVGTSNVLSLTNTLVNGDSNNRLSGIYLTGGTLLVPDMYSWTNFFIGVGTTNSVFSPTNMFIGSNATLLVDVPRTLDCAITILSNGWISHSVNQTTEQYKLLLAMNRDLAIQPGGQINADAKGYTGNKGLGAPVPNDNNGNHSGAGYGGEGSIAGDIARWGGNGGSTYGSVIAPTNLGSSTSFNNGGGVIILSLNGAATINGMVSANGANNSGGGGSGGSVYITAPALAGSGTIRADGGACPFSDQGSGGGGRIAVVLTATTDVDRISIHAAGGATMRYGAAGTVYLRVPGQGANAGTLYVNNLNTPFSIATTLVNTNVTDANVGTIVITNAAVLCTDTNATLAVNGNWVNTATFTARTNSTLLFAATNAATVYGSNVFWNLTATNSGKVLTFEAGKTNTVLGKITLANVTLNSTVNGQYTYLTLSTNGGSQQIGAVTVQDNNAGGGQQMLAGPRSANSGHNVNWKFPVSGTTFFFR